uniref:t-SNARE coiled-coil homology domain-containing protein n=1 Tax=Macrostomum lignano TaxID=282301 RepID=A0A1I8FQX4_9PLAT
ESPDQTRRRRRTRSPVEPRLQAWVAHTKLRMRATIRRNLLLAAASGRKPTELAAGCTRRRETELPRLSWRPSWRSTRAHKCHQLSRVILAAKRLPECLALLQQRCLRYYCKQARDARALSQPKSRKLPKNWLAKPKAISTPCRAAAALLSTEDANVGETDGQFDFAELQAGASSKSTSSSKRQTAVPQLITLPPEFCPDLTDKLPREAKGGKAAAASTAAATATPAAQSGGGGGISGFVKGWLSWVARNKKEARQMSIDQQFQQTSRLIREIEAALQRVEQSPQDAAPTAEREAQCLIDRFCSECDRLDILVGKQPAVRRQQAKLRADQFRYDCQHLQATSPRENEEREREALLRTSFTPNDSTSVLIDRSLAHNDSLNTANKRVDDMLAQGRSVLDNLGDQRAMLKRAHRGMLGVLNTLGFSLVYLNVFDGVLDIVYLVVQILHLVQQHLALAIDVALRQQQLVSVLVEGGRHWKVQPVAS